MRRSFPFVVLVGLLAVGTDRNVAGDPPTASIALRVRVVDEAGRPVVGAEVRAYAAPSLVRAFAGNRDPMAIFLPKETASARTISGGVARIELLEAERYVLRVTAMGYGLALLESAVAAEGGGPEVSVTLPQAVEVAGDVVDVAGKGIANAVVAFGPAEGLDLSEVESGLGRLVAITDPAGRFLIRGVPATRTPPRPETWLDGQMLYVAPTPSVLIRRTYGEKPLARLRVTVGGGAAVAGVAQTCGTHCEVPGARVVVFTLEETSEAERSLVTLSTESGADGAFRVVGVPKGWLEGALAAHPGYFASSSSDTQEAISDGRTVRTLGDLDATLSLVGRVLDADGKPVAGAEVVDWKASLGETTAVTDAEGRYRIDGIDRWRSIGRPNGGIARPIVLVVHARGLVQAHAAEKFDLDAATSKLGAATEIVHDVRLMPAASVAGRVLGVDGKPAAGVRVACAGEDRKASELWFDLVTGTDGSYVLPGLDAGTIVIEAGEAGPRGWALERVVLAAGERKSGVDLRLK